MRVTVFDHSSAVEVSVASQVIAILRRAMDRRGHATLLTSSGGMSRGVFRQLQERRSGLDWSRVRVIQLSELAGLAPADPGSLAHGLLTDLVEPLGVGDFRPINDATGSLVRPWPVYDALAWASDVALYDIGNDARLGFNQPGTARDGVSGTVALTAATLQDLGAPHGEVGEGTGHTAGMACLLSARHSIVMAGHGHQAVAVTAALDGPVSAAAPASWLRTARGVVDHQLAKAACVTGSALPGDVIDLRDQSSSTSNRRGVTVRER